MSVQHHDVYQSPSAAYAALGITDHYFKAIITAAHEGLDDPEHAFNALREIGRNAIRALCRTNATGHDCLLVDSSHKSSLEQDRLNAEYFEDSQNMQGPDDLRA